MKKILVPIDFSTPSIAAVDVACSIAAKNKAAVILLHVVEAAEVASFKISGEGRPSGLEEKLYNYRLLQASRDRLSQLVMKPRYSSVRVDGELRMGNPFHGIKTLIKRHKIDLVVMGVKGRSEWQEMLLGSNTEKVIRCAHVPVLTVNKRPDKIAFKRIVYATALLPNETAFSPVISKLQQLYKAKVHFLHINTPGKFQQDNKVFAMMEKFAKKLKLKNYTLNTYNDFSEEEGIVHFAEHINADLIAMPSHGRTGFAHLMAGSIAKDVVNYAKRPTLTYVIKK